MSDGEDIVIETAVKEHLADLKVVKMLLIDNRPLEALEHTQKQIETLENTVWVEDEDA